MNHEQLMRYLSNYTNQRYNICFVAGSTSLPVSLRKSVNVLPSAWSFKRKSPPSSNSPESSWNGHGCLCKEVRCCTGTWWGCRQHLSSLGLKSCAPSGLGCSFDVGWGWETVSVGRAQLSRLRADRLDLPSLQPELCTGSQVAQLILQPPAEQHPLCPGSHGGAANGRARALAKDKALQNGLGFVTELPCIRALAAISWCGALYKYTCKSCHLTGQVFPRGPVTLCGRSASGALAAYSFSILLGTLLSMPGPAPVGFFDHRDLQNKAGRYFPYFGSLLKRLCEPVSLLTPWSFPAMATLAQKVPDLLSHGRMPMENSMREGMEDEREILEIVCSSFKTVSLWVRNKSQLAERREHWPLSWSSQVVLPALLLNEPCSPSPYTAMWKRQD